MGVELAGNDRLIIQHKVSIIQLLPESYVARLEATPGVVDVLHQTWFGGIYQEPKNFFMQCPVDPERLLAHVSGVRAARRTRRRPGSRPHRAPSSAARRPIDSGSRSATAFPSRPPSGARRAAAAPGNSTSAASTTATRRASTRRRSSSTTTTSTRRAQFGEGQVGWYVIRINDPAEGARDRQTDRRGVRQLLRRDQDDDREGVPAGLRPADRRHRRDHPRHRHGGVLHHPAGRRPTRWPSRCASGRANWPCSRRSASPTAWCWCWCCSSRAPSPLLGGGIGLGLAYLVTLGGDPTGGMLPVFFLPPADLVRGALFALGLGVVAGHLPAVQAMRLRIVDALRRTWP